MTRRAELMAGCRQLAASAWCDRTTSHIVMIPALAEQFAKILYETCLQHELFRELFTPRTMSQQEWIDAFNRQPASSLKQPDAIRQPAPSEKHEVFSHTSPGSLKFCFRDMPYVDSLQLSRPGDRADWWMDRNEVVRRLKEWYQKPKTKPAPEFHEIRPIIQDVTGEFGVEGHLVTGYEAKRVAQNEQPAPVEQPATKRSPLTGVLFARDGSIADQPAPAPNRSRPIWELVIADMKERDSVGRQRYGTPLQANNGRDALVDAYQEALDLAVYLRQAIEERAQARVEKAVAHANKNCATAPLTPQRGAV